MSLWGTLLGYLSNNFTIITYHYYEQMEIWKFINFSSINFKELTIINLSQDKILKFEEEAKCLCNRVG